MNFLHNFNVVPNEIVDLNINIDNDANNIQSINEIILTGIFIDRFQIVFNGNPTTYILDSLTKNDESITTQRIVFY